MLTVPIYNQAGERVGEESIDPADFGGTVNKQLLHEVVLMHLANRRVGTVNTRGRADVAGSGKKLFRQKGTGNARAGSKRTNKRKGGGVAFARRNRDYSYRLPKKAVRAAVRMAILSKFQDSQALVVESLGHGNPDAAPKTKLVAQTLKSLPLPDAHRSSGDAPAASSKPDRLNGKTLLIGLPASDPVLYRSARNIAGVQVAPVGEFNTYDILKQRYLVLTRESLAALKKNFARPPARRGAPAVPSATSTESD